MYQFMDFSVLSFSGSQKQNRQPKNKVTGFAVLLLVS